jgi:nucleolar protein 58
MIMRWHRPGQKMAVGKPEYKEIIERNLVSQSSLDCLCLSNLGHQFCFHFFKGVPCLFNEIVMEVMWGL